ncbi:hypothetical protein HYU91_01435 [Candidatus Collierbacteria bacterium]|nr:hypothetical protein [Candidatus Collierbacteria bacterium]
MSEQRKTRIAWTIIFVGATIVLAGGIIRTPVEVPLGIACGALMAAAITSISLPKRIDSALITTVVMVIVAAATSVAGGVSPVSPSFYWGMLGLVIGWILGLAFSWD